MLVYIPKQIILKYFSGFKYSVDKQELHLS